MKKIMSLYTKTIPIPIPMLCVAVFFVNTTCHAEVTPMSIEQLETETAKGFSATTNPLTGGIDFAVEQQTKSGTPVSASGTLDVLQKTDTINQASLSLNDSAQQNLRALVSVNAVDSAVQVLVNMNVNIGSTVGIIEQANQALSNQEFFTR